MLMASEVVCTTPGWGYLRWVHAHEAKDSPIFVFWKAMVFFRTFKNNYRGAGFFNGAAKCIRFFGNDFSARIFCHCSWRGTIANKLHYVKKIAQGGWTSKR
jgi:hypothetical protein